MYFIFPIDVIPDPIPFLGFTDDFLILALALLTVYEYVDNDVKQKAREKFDEFFG